MTPLMLAVVNQPKDAVLDVQVTDARGITKQSSSTRGQFVGSLLKIGADRSLKNKEGKTALDLAREIGNEEMLSLLSK